MPTAHQSLIEHILADQGYDLTKSVRRKRRAGESWQTIAYWVADHTHHRITAETLRRWYKPDK